MGTHVAHIEKHCCVCHNAVQRGFGVVCRLFAPVENGTCVVSAQIKMKRNSYSVRTSLLVYIAISLKKSEIPFFFN